MRKTALLSAVALAVLPTGALFVDRSYETTHADTVDGAMALNVSSGATCEGPADQPTACAVPLGGSFSLTVDVIEIPTSGDEPGYIGFSSLVDFGDLEYLPATKAAYEVLWPDSALPLRHERDDAVLHGALSNLHPPFPVSTFEGSIVEIELRCGATPSQHEIELSPYDYPYPSVASGFKVPIAQTVRADVANNPLAVTCGSEGDPPVTPPGETPQPTPPPPSASMALTLDSGGTCDETTCSVPLDGTFAISVHVTEVPTKGSNAGYIAFGTSIGIGGLRYDPALTVEEEIVWPDAQQYLRGGSGIKGYLSFQALTGGQPPFPVSTYEGAVVQTRLDCSPGYSEHTLALGEDGSGFMLPSGEPLRADVSDPLTIVCGEPGDVAVGDSDCSGYVTAMDAALVLQKDVGMMDSVPCPVGADADADGDIDSIDAAVILMFDASLIHTLPP